MMMYDGILIGLEMFGILSNVSERGMKCQISETASVVEFGHDC